MAAITKNRIEQAAREIDQIKKQVAEEMEREQREQIKESLLSRILAFRHVTRRTLSKPR